jgi:alcohol dehydrogenase
MSKSKAMKTAILNEFGSPLTVEHLQDQVLGAGAVVLDVFAAQVLGYANEVFSKASNYLLELSILIGRVLSDVYLP